MLKNEMKKTKTHAGQAFAQCLHYPTDRILVILVKKLFSFTTHQSKSNGVKQGRRSRKRGRYYEMIPLKMIDK